MSSDNLLLKEIEYKTEETNFGIRRSYVYPNGKLFSEFKSHTEMMGLPFIHFTRGKNPETGKRIIAKGIIAIGRISFGVISIGQLALGFLAIGQFALGIVVLAQFAGALHTGIGQIVASYYMTIAQVGYGEYVLAQVGIGEYVMDMRNISPEAAEFFKPVLSLFK
ncbi:hypothetical protein ACFL7D_02790 [candidate division KSB1 bacterium]